MMMLVMLMMMMMLMIHLFLTLFLRFAAKRCGAGETLFPTKTVVLLMKHGLTRAMKPAVRV